MEPLTVGWVTSTLLLSVRLGALALMAPPLGGRMVPATVRFSLVIALAVALSSALPAAPMTTDGLGRMPALAALIPAVASEAALGAAMALGLNLAFGMFTFGAHILDVQIGFAMGQVIDPMSQQHMPVIAAIFNQTALIGFFLLDGHHALMRGLVLSTEAVPLGSAWHLDSGFVGVVRHLSQLFSLGFAMVAPVVFCLLLAELGLGAVARNLPQMNMLALGMPIKVLIGMATLSVWIGASAPIMGRAYHSVFAAWELMWR